MKKFITIPLIALMAMPFVAGATGYDQQQEQEVIEAQEYDDGFLSEEEIERERALEQERMEEERMHEQQMEEDYLEDEEFYGDQGKTRTERSRDAINTSPDYEE
ncbi:MAG: hypothetical protein ACLGHN_02385 [Bacteriovoracia bacterium]